MRGAREPARARGRAPGSREVPFKGLETRTPGLNQSAGEAGEGTGGWAAREATGSSGHGGSLSHGRATQPQLLLPTR